MSEPANTAITKRTRPKWLVFVFLPLAAVITAVLLWFAGFVFRNNDPLFRGQPESEWIRNLKYHDDEQVKEWRAYGEAGIQVLVRGLDHANHPGERAYRALYRNAPRSLMRWLPAPKSDSTRSTRMCLVSLLSGLREDARAATPVMGWTLSHDEAESVRAIAIGFFTSSEDEKCLLNQMPANEKQKLLPALLRDLQNPTDWGLRNNAANALRWFPERREIVAPALTSALRDSQPQVALLAATALHCVAPDLIANAGVVTIVALILKNPDDQIAHRAAELLGKLKAEPSVSIPALIEGLNSTNLLVSADSTRALLRFDQPTDLILPALEAAMHRKDFPPWLKNDVKKKIERLSPSEIGTN